MSGVCGGCFAYFKGAPDAAPKQSAQLLAPKQSAAPPQPAGAPKAAAPKRSAEAAKLIEMIRTKYKDDPATAEKKLAALGLSDGPAAAPKPAAPKPPAPQAAPPGKKPSSPTVPSVQDSHETSLGNWHLQYCAQLQRTDKCRLVFLGDSITEGWLQEGRKIWLEKFVEPYGAFNLGIGADEVQHVLCRVQSRALQGLNPEVIVILVGTNNVGVSGHKAEDVAAGIRMLLDDLRTRLPNAKLLLLGIFPRGMTGDDPARKVTKAINTIIQGYGDDKDIFYLDIGPKFLPMTHDNMVDFLHLSAKGYGIWADAIQETLTRLMPESRQALPPVPVAPEVPAFPPPGGEQSPTVPSPQHKPGLVDFPHWQLKHYTHQQRSDNCQLAFLGDLNTEGWMTTGRKIWKEKYVDPYGAFNLGVGADEVQHVLWRVQHGAFEGLNPKVIVVLVGYKNVGGSGHMAKDVAAGIRMLLDDLRTRLPNAKLLLLGILPCGMRGDGAHRLETQAVNKIIKDYGDDKNIFYLDIGPSYIPMSQENMFDYLQLSEQGYGIWADAMQATLTRLMQ